MGIPPDFHQSTTIPGAPLRRIHRRINEADFYFVADSNPKAQTVECAFRVKGKQPDLWHPDTGRIEKAPIWHEQKDGTALRLRFDPAGSVFVVFRDNSVGSDPVLALSRDAHDDENTVMLQSTNGEVEVSSERDGVFEAKTASGRVLRAEVRDVPRPLVLGGKWDVNFAPGLGAPEHIVLDHLISWTDYTNAGVKYFSGAARYTKDFELPADFIAKNRRVILDLGKVQVIAAVQLNGQDMGILWKPPFRLDVTESAKPGKNQLELKVVNLWPNRLIGDEQLAEDCEWRTHGADYGDPLLKWPAWLLKGEPSPTGRFTFATWKHWYKNSPLLESGLLGPVTLTCAQRAIFK
jgi:hypothetical protein